MYATLCCFIGSSFHTVTICHIIGLYLSRRSCLSSRVACRSHHPVASLWSSSPRHHQAANRVSSRPLEWQPTTHRVTPLVQPKASSSGLPSKQPSRHPSAQPSGCTKRCRWSSRLRQKLFSPLVQTFQRATVGLYLSRRSCLSSRVACRSHHPVASLWSRSPRHHQAVNRVSSRPLEYLDAAVGLYVPPCNQPAVQSAEPAASSPQSPASGLWSGSPRHHPAANRDIPSRNRRAVS
jgi:hypothetical protein